MTQIGRNENVNSVQQKLRIPFSVNREVEKMNL